MQNLYHLQKVFRNFSLKNKDIFTRTYLTAASHCNDVWKGRLKEELLKDAMPLETSYKLLEKHSKENIIFAIDLDIFANCITDETLTPVLENLKDILLKYRVCSDNYKILPSTNYAVLRLLINGNYIDDMLTMLDNRIQYGLFLDNHTAKLFFDKCLTEEKYTEAVKCATHLMLQEDFTSQICTSFAILSCFKYILTKDQDPMKSYLIIEEEPEDDVTINLHYEPNNVLDDHFDLTDEKHIIGKTLVYAAVYIEDDLPFIKHNATILGWSLFEKWLDCENALEEAKAKDIPLAIEIIPIIEEQLKKCENEETVNKLQNILQSVRKSNDDEADKINVHIESWVKNKISECENKEIEDQNMLLVSWNKIRQEVYNKLQEKIRIDAIDGEIKEHEKYIQNKEELLNFYEQEEKWKMRAKCRREEVIKRTNIIQCVTKKEKKFEDYIIPELSDMGSLNRMNKDHKKVKREGRRYVKRRDIKDLVVTKSRKHCGFHLYRDWK